MDFTTQFMMMGASALDEIPREIGQAFGGGFYAGNIFQGGIEYYLVVSPRASGQSSSELQFKTTKSAAPLATETLNNGPAASGSMTSTIYPASRFCQLLNINGFTDWYLPSRDELEICYRNLKPNIPLSSFPNSNDTSNRAKSSITYPEGDDISSDTMGVNRNSRPTRSGYAATVPGQTSALAFRTGGAEAFDTVGYWSSSAFVNNASNSAAWAQEFFSGGQANAGFDDTRAVRAVRRVPV
jgi:hypothetical protein